MGYNMAKITVCHYHSQNAAATTALLVHSGLRNMNCNLVGKYQSYDGGNEFVKRVGTYLLN
jgi:hypothetical protein